MNNHLSHVNYVVSMFMSCEKVHHFEFYLFTYQGIKRAVHKCPTNLNEQKQRCKEESAITPPQR